LTSSGSDFRIRGTLADSMSAQRRCTTMRMERLRSDYSGWQCREDAGESIGRARIGVFDPSG